MDVIDQRRSAGETFVTHQLLGVNAAIGFAESDVPLAGDFSESVIERHGSEITAQVLFAFQRLEQCFEVAGTEALGALTLDDLIEERRSVFHWLRENLEEIPFLVAVDENAKIAQARDILVDVADPV